jgi:acetyl-CoA acetyltransferase
MREVVVVSALRSPIGKKNGSLIARTSASYLFTSTEP